MTAIQRRPFNSALGAQFYTMEIKYFKKENGSIFAYILVSLVVSFANTVVQLYLYTFYIRDLLPEGWGGLVGPFVVSVKSLILTLPLTCIVLLFCKGTYYSILSNWRYWVAYYLPLVAVTCFIITITQPLDGGGTLLSRYFTI